MSIIIITIIDTYLKYIIVGVWSMAVTLWQRFEYYYYYYHYYCYYYYCKRSDLSGLFNGHDFRYIYIYIYIYIANLYVYMYIFQAVRRAVNVKMFLRVSKYPPNAIFHSANINAQRANITGSMNWHSNVELDFACPDAEH